jgi:hypothetical protein
MVVQVGKFEWCFNVLGRVPSTGYLVVYSSTGACYDRLES